MFWFSLEALYVETNSENTAVQITLTRFIAHFNDVSFIKKNRNKS